MGSSSQAPELCSTARIQSTFIRFASDFRFWYTESPCQLKGLWALVSKLRNSLSNCKVQPAPGSLRFRNCWQTNCSLGITRFCKLGTGVQYRPQYHGILQHFMLELQTRWQSLVSLVQARSITVARGLNYMSFLLQTF